MMPPQRLSHHACERQAREPRATGSSRGTRAERPISTEKRLAQLKAARRFVDGEAIAIERTGSPGSERVPFPSLVPKCLGPGR
jgi:hypothetical protein